MKRRSLLTSVAIAGVVALVGCSTEQPDPDPTPSAQTAPSETGTPSDKASKAPSDVDPELREQVDLFVGDSISAQPTAIDSASKVMEEADSYLEKHEGSAADGTDNPFATLKNFSDETNEGLFKIYSKDSKLLKYFDLEGLRPNEKAAIALWSQSMPLIFATGEVVIPSEAFLNDGNKATVDLAKGTVTNNSGQGSLLEANQDLGKLPMVKRDGEWLIDSKAYYTKLENINS